MAGILSVPFGASKSATNSAAPRQTAALSFQQLDANGDGVIDRAEWSAAGASSEPSGRRSLAEVLAEARVVAAEVGQITSGRDTADGLQTVQPAVVPTVPTAQPPVPPGIRDHESGQPIQQSMQSPRALRSALVAAIDLIFHRAEKRADGRVLVLDISVVVIQQLRVLLEIPATGSADLLDVAVQSITGGSPALRIVWLSHSVYPSALDSAPSLVFSYFLPLRFSILLLLVLHSVGALCWCCAAVGAVLLLVHSVGALCWCCTLLVLHSVGAVLLLVLHVGAESDGCPLGWTTRDAFVLELQQSLASVGLLESISSPKKVLESLSPAHSPVKPPKSPAGALALLQLTAAPQNNSTAQ